MTNKIKIKHRANFTPCFMMGVKKLILNFQEPSSQIDTVNPFT